MALVRLGLDEFPGKLRQVGRIQGKPLIVWVSMMELHHVGVIGFQAPFTDAAFVRNQLGPERLSSPGSVVSAFPPRSFQLCTLL